MPAIDRLEGFRTGCRGLYRQMLAPVLVKKIGLSVWMYGVEIEPLKWPRLAAGYWTD